MSLSDIPASAPLQSSHSHLAAENKYDLLRAEARSLAEKAIPAQLQGLIRMAGIDQDALNQVFAWKAKRRAQGIDIPWSFPDGFNSFRFRHPNRLDVAIWAGSTLCSLAIGIPTKTGASMRLDVIEASPDVTPISGEVFAVNITAFEAYAFLIGAGSITVMRPLNQKLVNFYKSKGYVFLKSKGSAPARMWKAL